MISTLRGTKRVRAPTPERVRDEIQPIINMSRHVPDFTLKARLQHGWGEPLAHDWDNVAPEVFTTIAAEVIASTRKCHHCGKAERECKLHNWSEFPENRWLEVLAHNDIGRMIKRELSEHDARMAASTCKRLFTKKWAPEVTTYKITEVLWEMPWWDENNFTSIKNRPYPSLVLEERAVATPAWTTHEEARLTIESRSKGRPQGDIDLLLWRRREWSVEGDEPGKVVYRKERAHFFVRLYAKPALAKIAVMRELAWRFNSLRVTLDKYPYEVHPSMFPVRADELDVMRQCLTWHAYRRVQRFCLVMHLPTAIAHSLWMHGALCGVRSGKGVCRDDCDYSYHVACGTARQQTWACVAPLVMRCVRGQWHTSFMSTYPVPGWPEFEIQVTQPLRVHYRFSQYYGEPVRSFCDVCGAEVHGSGTVEVPLN